MGSGKTKLLIVMVIFVTVCCMCFGNEQIDTMCGIWVYPKDTGIVVALQKISEMEYFVVHLSLEGFFSPNIAGVGTVVSDNMIHLTQDGSDFYVFMDYENDSVYLLWNHTFPDGIYFDVELKRVTEVFDKELNEKKKVEEEEQMRKAFEEWVYTNVMNGTWKD